MLNFQGVFMNFQAEFMNNCNCTTFTYLRSMVKLFSGNRAGVLLLLPLFIVLYYFLNNFSGNHYDPGVVNLGFWGDSSSLFSNATQLLAGTIICFNAIGINLIYNANEFLERNNYMSSLLYVVLMSFYHSFYSLDGLLLAHSAIILMIHQFFQLRQNSDGRANVFNGALFAGLAASFHPPMVGMIPFVLIMVWNIRPFNFRETLLTLVGFSIPLLYAGTYYWYSGHKIELNFLQQASDYYKEQTDFFVTATLFTLLLLLSLVSIRARMLKSSIRLKKMVNMLWWLLGVGLIYGLIDFIFFDQIERFSFLMVPLSFFLTFSFSHKTFGGVASVLFYLTFLYSLINFFL